HVPFRVDRDVGETGGFPFADRAHPGGPRRVEVASRDPFLDAVVEGVGDPDVTHGVGQDPDRVLQAELALAGAGRTEPAEVFAGRVELLDPAVVLVADPDVAPGVDRDPRR